MLQATWQNFDDCIVIAGHDTGKDASSREPQDNLICVFSQHEVQIHGSVSCQLAKTGGPVHRPPSWEVQLKVFSQTA